MTNAEPPIKTYVKFGGGLPSYWFDALGWIAYFFAQLEWASYEVVGQLESKTRLKRSFSLTFHERSLRAAELTAQNAALDPSLRAEWQAFWDKVVAKGGMRNNVMHNPLTADMVRMGSSTEVGPDDGIKLMRKNGQPILKLGTIQAFADELRDLNTEMLSLFERTSFPPRT